MIPESSEKLLQKGLEQLNLCPTAAQFTKLYEYLRVLTEWNKTFNLTAIRDFDDMVVHHLLDSFAIQPFILAHQAEQPHDLGVFKGSGGACFDIGSGAGVPGVPLAILNPEIQWTLVDSNGKKARFLKHVKREAELLNVAVSQKRIEQLEVGSDIRRPLLITARALAAAGKVIELIKPFVRPGDRILLMKGLKGAEEANDTIEGFLPFNVHQIQVPFLEAERCLLSTEFIGMP